MRNTGGLWFLTGPVLVAAAVAVGTGETGIGVGTAWAEGERDTPMAGPPGSGVAPVRVEPATVTVGIVGDHGVPVYCTHNVTDGRARPDADGGYRLVGLRPGRWTVSLDLPHERVDVLVTVDAGEMVVVPPVVARGPCRSITLARRMAPRPLAEVGSPTWALRYDRQYRAQPGQRAAALAGWSR
jgi:hypothetical protein